MDDDTFQQNEILNNFHFNIDLLSPDLKYSWSMSEKSGILVMLNVLITSFVGVESFDKSSIFIYSHFPCQCIILPCLHTLLFACPPLLTCLITSQLLCHFLSHLLGHLESSHYFSTFSYCCCNRILHYHSQFVWSLEKEALRLFYVQSDISGCLTYCSCEK